MSQIFKQPVPTEKLMKLLEDISQKHSKHYLFDNAAYKKGILNNLIPEFVNLMTSSLHHKLNMINRFITLIIMFISMCSAGSLVL